MFIINSATVGSSTITTLASQSWSAGMERIITGAAGNYQGEFIALMRQTSRCALTTRTINALSAPSLADGALFGRVIANGGTGSASYISLAGATGRVLWLPRSISWAAGSPAVLSLEAIFLSADGSTAPITIGTTAGDLTAEAKDWVGGGTGVQAISVDFGYNVTVIPDGNLYPQNAIVVGQSPSLSIVTTDTTLLTTGNANPGAVASLSVVFNEIANGGVRGTALTFSLTGHKHVESINYGRPGTISVSVAGTGGFTIA